MTSVRNRRARAGQICIGMVATLCLATVGCSSGGDGDSAIQNARSVVINEVYPHGADPVSDPDWVELKNPTDGTADLSGFVVRDSKTPFSLPAGTTIPAGGYLVVFCDDSPVGAPADRIHLPFKLGGADSFSLLDAAATPISTATWDAVSAPTGKSYGRLPDGTGLFMALTPTRGARNI